MQKRKERIEFLQPEAMAEPGLIDLSESGVAIWHPKKQNGNATITINDLQLKAKLIYCAEKVGGYRIGMQFMNVTPEKMKVLKGLVEKFSRGVPLDFKAEF